MAAPISFRKFTFLMLFLAKNIFYDEEKFSMMNKIFENTDNNNKLLLSKPRRAALYCMHRWAALLSILSRVAALYRTYKHYYLY